jgi:hypothetical protein
MYGNKYLLTKDKNGNTIKILDCGFLLIIFWFTWSKHYLYQMTSILLNESNSYNKDLYKVSF